jgi:hypothetical protein
VHELDLVGDQYGIRAIPVMNVIPEIVRFESRLSFVTKRSDPAAAAQAS